MNRVYWAIGITIATLLAVSWFVDGTEKISDSMLLNLEEIVRITDIEASAPDSADTLNKLEVIWDDNNLRWHIVFGKDGVYELQTCLDGLRMSIEHEEWTAARTEATHCIRKIEEVWSYHKITLENLF